MSTVQLDRRDYDALVLAASRPIVQLAPGVYLVPSRGAVPYRVTLAANACTCPDSTLRGSTCKHLRAAALVASRG